MSLLGYTMILASYHELGMQPVIKQIWRGGCASHDRVDPVTMAPASGLEVEGGSWIMQVRQDLPEEEVPLQLGRTGGL